MKKTLIALLITVSLLLTALLPAQAAVFGSTTAGEMAVSVNAYCDDFNGVGMNWDGYYSINNTEITDDTFTIYLTRGDKLDFYTLLGEMDSNPDYGQSYEVYDYNGRRHKTYKVLARDIRDGFTVRQYIDVMENGGRYRGYYCTWIVDYTFTPLY